MDESFIYERLRALSGGLERAEYRDISKAFEEVVRYDRRAFEELKQSLQEELRDVSERFYLYGAAAAAGDVPIVNDFLFPIDETGAEGSIATIFCPCPLGKMQKIFEGSRTMVAETEDGETEIVVQIKPCLRYKNKIEELRNIFYENGVYWRTPYLPYTDRFGDVFCEDFETGREIRSLRFKDEDIPVRLGLIPLWNVEPVSLKCTVFPIPAIDERNYRHTLRLPFAEDGYVVRMEETVKNVYLRRDSLEVVSEEKIQKDFDLYRIAVRRDVKVPHYPLTSNFRRLRFIDRQSDQAVSRIGSRAEIARIVTSYEAAEGLRLTGIEEGVRGTIGSSQQRYGYVSGGQKNLLLHFHTDREDFLTEDRVLFLVSEVQHHYPQFCVTGDYAAAFRG